MQAVLQAFTESPGGARAAESPEPTNTLHGIDIVMPLIRGVLVSYCGLTCEFCRAYSGMGGSCGGCDAHAEECEFAKCARRKGVVTCLSCAEFPCRLHREGFEWESEELGKVAWKPFSDVLLEYFSRLSRRVEGRASGNSGSS